MKIAVITHILHKVRNTDFYSYEPYIREMNIWFKNVSNVILVSPRSYSSITKIESKYEVQDIDFYEVPQISLLSALSIFKTIFNLPKVIYNVATAMNAADHIHLRCPGNIGLIGCVLQIFFPKKPKTVKYAGNWDPNAKQPWSYNLQKRILSSTVLSKNIKVLTYGKWKNQSRNIIPFFTASFSERDKIMVKKKFSSPYELLFVGNLNEGKRPFFAIRFVEYLLMKKVPVKLKIFGNGILDAEIKQYLDVNNLDTFIQLMGVENLQNLKENYKKSDFLILPSKSEGWPKAVAEAMFFGCIPISTNVSCVEWMLDEGARGILIPANIEEAAEIFINELNIDNLKLKSTKAQSWSQQYTLEKFAKEIDSLL